MNFFIIQKDTQWFVYGPVRLVKTLPENVALMDDGKHYPIALCYKTKGGATKACYRRNYANRTRTDNQRQGPTIKYLP